MSTAASVGVSLLQIRLWEAEEQATWYLRRIHELEAQLQAWRSAAAGTGRPAGSPLSDDRRPGSIATDDLHDRRNHANRLLVRELERQVKAYTAELRQKELVIADLATVAEECRKAAERSSAEAQLLRVAAAGLSIQVDEKERLITSLSETARESLQQLEAAQAEAQEIRARCGLLLLQLHQKDQEIVDLTAFADERLRLVEVQARAIEEKERLIEEQARAVEDKEREIVHLAASANERLQLVERLDAEVQQLRAELERLTGATHAEERVNEDSPLSD